MTHIVQTVLAEEKTMQFRKSKALFTFAFMFSLIVSEGTDKRQEPMLLYIPDCRAFVTVAEGQAGHVFPLPCPR